MHLLYGVDSIRNGWSPGELIFLVKTNMGFSSRFFKVNEKLNLQRKRYVKSRQVNLTLSRFIRLLHKKCVIEKSTQSVQVLNDTPVSLESNAVEICLENKVLAERFTGLPADSESKV